MKLLNYCEFKNEFKRKDSDDVVSYDAVCAVISNNGYITSNIMPKRVCENWKSLIGCDIDILYRLNPYTKKTSIAEVKKSESVNNSKKSNFEL